MAHENSIWIKPYHGHLLHQNIDIASISWINEVKKNRTLLHNVGLFRRGCTTKKCINWLVSMIRVSWKNRIKDYRITLSVNEGAHLPRHYARRKKISSAALTGSVKIITRRKRAKNPCSLSPPAGTNATQGYSQSRQCLPGHEEVFPEAIWRVFFAVFSLFSCWNFSPSEDEGIPRE